MRKTLCGMLVLGAASGAFGEAGAPVNLDSLVADLAGPENAARIVARQLLPRESAADAVPALLPLL